MAKNYISVGNLTVIVSRRLTSIGNVICEVISRGGEEEGGYGRDIWWITCIPTPSESFGVFSGISVQLK